MKLYKIEQIIHEESLSSFVCRVWLSPDKTCILKISYNPIRWRREVYYLSLLRDIIPVPTIKETLPPKILGFGAILMNDVPGEIVPASALTNELAFAMGSLLAQLHEIKVDCYGDLSAHEGADQATPHSVMENYLNSSLEECKDVVDPDLLNRCLQFFQKHASILDHVDGPCLAHRDYRPGNILVHQGKIQALIDFEIAQGSFAEEDFLQMDRLVWLRHPESRKPFMKGYSSVRPLPNLNKVLPLLRILKALGAIGFTVERNTYRSTHHYILSENLAFLEDFFS